MILSPIFSEQVRLLVTTLPQIHKEECFALKGKLERILQQAPSRLGYGILWKK